MNEDLLPHNLNPTSDSNVSSSETTQKKYILSQDLLSTPYTPMTLPGANSSSRSLAGSSQTLSQVFSVQQIKDILLQESRKREQQFTPKERNSCSSTITSSCSYPLVTESLNINISPSQVLNHSHDAVSNQNVADEVSDLSGIISINSISTPRITSHHESFQGSSINENSLLRGSISCENSLSDLTPSITPVNLIDTSADSLIFEKEVFSVDQTSQASFSKESSLISKDDKEPNTNSVNNVVTTNRLLSKLIQSYKPDTATNLPLRISEFTKIPNASLKPSVPNDMNNIGKVSLGTSTLSSTLAVSSSSHIMPLHNNVIDFNSRSSISNPITISQNTLSGISSSVSSDTYSSSHSVSISSKLQQPLQQLDELNFSEHYEDRVQQSCNGVLNEQLLAKSMNKRHDIQTTSCNLVNKDIRFSYTEPRSEPMLVSGEQLIPENSMSIAIETNNPLSFMQEQQILSHYDNDIATDIKENRSLRQVDVFLSDLHSSNDHDLLRGPLTNTIVPDMASSTTSPVVSETTLSTSIGNGNHLPELPPSPILANISPDFLVGGSSSAPKTSPSSQPSFLPSLSTTTENLALSFSSHFLENSNMSIDIGNLSEGDASLNVPSQPFSDSLDSSGGKRSLGNELTFTNALKNATEKSHYDKSPRSSSEADIVQSNFLSGAKHLTHMDSLSFKGNSVIQTAARTSPEIFKVPSQAKHSLNYESFPSPSKQNSFSAKEIPLIKIDSSEPHHLHKMQSSKVPESLVEEVSCFKCQLCSYLSLDKREINEHMKVKHENSLIEAIDSHLNVNSEEKISVKKELFPIKKRKKKESKKVSNKGLSSKKVKKEVAPQMKVELLPNKKGGFQKNIVLVNEEDADEQTSSLDSQEMVENSIYRSALISLQSSNSSFRFRTEDTLKETKLDFICDENNFNRKSNAMHPRSSGLSSSEDEVDEASNHSTNKVSDTSVNKSICQNGYKVQNKVGRPTASQTMGIGKFKKSHPKVPVTDETLGIKCGINGCGLRLKEEGNILYHRKCHVEAFLKCPECHSKYPHWSSLATHLWRSHMIDMELNKCPKCTFKSYSYTKLMNGHWKTHSNERPFLCDVCGKDFKTAKQLRSHKVLHGDKKEELKHHCDMCQRKFAEKRMLLLHLEAVHKKVKPYLCNYCGNSFASKSTLNLHIRKHTGEKPFACESCNYRTSDHNSMRRHKMKHTNDRPYSCPYCDYSSIQSSTFKVHLRRKHEFQAQKDGLIFSCSYCTFKTVKKDNYLAHVGTHHISSADEQNKEAERQQQEINKATFKNRSRKPQNQILQKSTEVMRQLSNDRQHSVIASTSAVAQESYPLSNFKKNTHMYLLEKQTSMQFQELNQHQHQQQQQQQQQQHQQQQQQQQQYQQLLPQQIIVAKTQLPTSITEGGENNTRTILVTNGNSKTSHALSQQPMFYVLGEFVPVPQMVNVDINDPSSDVNSDNGNSILLQNNVSSSRPVILNSISNDEHFAYTNAEEALIQSVNINDGIVQLTPEVVAMPVTTDLVPLSQSQSVPGMIYVATSNEVETSSSSKMIQNSSVFP